MRKSPAPKPRTPSSGSTTRRSSRSRGRGSSRLPKATTKSTDGPPRRTIFVAVGLGANLGPAAATVRAAARALASLLTGARLSPLYRTSPVGGPPQPPFVNAVLVGFTSLPAADLLARLKRLEGAAGRRRGPRNAPRPLDLDLLLYGRTARPGPAPVLPHPRLASRLFVLVPLADVAPRRLVPGTGKTVARLLREARRVSRETVRAIQERGGGVRVSNFS